MDFRHPFISRPKLTIYYVVFWIVLSTANALIKWLSYNAQPDVAALETFAFLFLYAIVGAAIWYVIKFSTLEDYGTVRILLSHLFASSVIVFIWMYLGVVIIKLFHPTPEAYIEENLAANIYVGYFFYLIYVLFFYAVNYYHGFREKLKNEGKLKMLVKEAELHALKSQINPHFLFNSLNSISSLTMTEPDRAQEMVINLSDLMRYSLKHDQEEEVTFEEELENNKLYLKIEKVRFGNKLNPVFDINENCLKAKIPNMILQPLYENAIKYGVYETTEPVDVVTTCRQIDGALEVVISNTYDASVKSKKGEGIGLRNIRDRLQIIYGNPLLMKVEDNKKEFKVTLAIPQK